jgi:dephospho-CoA kinase
MSSVDNFKEWLNEGVNDPAIFKAIFMAGGPGSGKSYVQGNAIPSSAGFKVINSDDIFELKMKQADLELDPESIYSPQGQEIRQASKKITAARMRIYLQGRLGLVLDGTGKDLSKIKKQVKVLRESGYDCYMIFVNTSEEVALDRNEQRSRSLPVEDVSKMWNAVQRNIGAFQNLFGSNNFMIVDNNKTNDKVMNMAYKDIQKFSKKPIKNFIAKQWIENMKALARRK